MARALSIAEIAAPIRGDSLYHERARQALPLLVRQAEAGQPIFYSDLADELGMPNPRNLNYPLGAIGRTMKNLTKAWKERVPPLQTLVVNRQTGIPGEGVGGFLKDWGDFENLPRDKRVEIVKGAHALIFGYPRWQDVLRFLSLKPVTADYSHDVGAASAMPRGGGEGERHRALKNYVAENPACIGLAKTVPRGETEYNLPSGDSLDVFFGTGRRWVAAEIKSRISPREDIIRGLFQCVKYLAVMTAVQAAEGKPRNARVVLVLEGTLPPDLIELRSLLGVEVCQGIVPVERKR